MTEVTSPEPSAPERPLWQRVGARVGIALAMGSALVWLWAIAQTGNVEPTDTLEDQTFAEAAEPICAAAMAVVGDFPRAVDAASPDERAGVIRESSAVLSTMTGDLRAVVPDDDQADAINLWIDDWDGHIADRLDFARRLETEGGGEEFLETAKAGTQLSRSINRFATVNDMASCETPGDV